YYFNFRIFGEPARQFPELDCLMILLSLELLRRLWSIQGRWQAAVKTSVALLAFVSFLPSCQYLQKCWTIFVGDPNPTDRLEYQMQDWVYRNMPQSRVLASGTIRFWFNAWHDLPQLKGGSDQGLLNPKVVPPGWEIHLGKDPVLSILWMQILGVDAVLVNGKKSREHYRDHQFPYKFAGQLPVLWDNGADDVIYGVPRRYRSLARVVNRQQHDTLPVITGNGNLPHLEAWYNDVENGRDSPTETHFEGTDTMHIRAQVREGESVWVAESFDPNWRATIKQQAVPMREDKLGMMILDTPPGSHDIRLEFPVPFETQAGRVISVISALVAVALVCGGRLL
ncbi:MAG: hypothetical protein H7Y20_19005, partial [Bryobacteraceae bacterium]|nr:hypothetical protein [Bryobacteraceae bacterium]